MKPGLEKSAALRRPTGRWAGHVAVLAAGLVAGMIGCTPAVTPVGEWRGPAAVTPFERAPWTFVNESGEVLTSRDYRVHSTVQNSKIRERLIQLLEAALLEYRRLVPNAPPTDRPMEAYLFGDRPQWSDFTRKNTGADASVYLQIQRGGYALRDFFVAYYNPGGEAQLWSVTAHEGFHQFCARSLKGRLPPFLEEGLACTFEVVHWEEGTDLPRFNPRVNPGRAHSLRLVLEGRAAWPLEQLIRLHAGSVVGQPGPRIEAFYSQSWAFARFLQEYEHGKYRPAFNQWLDDTVTGGLFDPTGTHRRSQQYWDPAAVRPILEHYLGTDLPALAKEFDGWCRYIAFDEFARQWASR